MPSDSSSTPRMAAPTIAAAQALVRAGRLAEAEQAFRQVLVTEPEQVPALRFLAGAALRRGAAGEAIDLLNRAAQVDRNDIGTLMELGIAYRVADRMDAARYVLERALELGGGRDSTVRVLLANVLELDQRPELALLHYFRAILEAQRAGLWFDDGTTPPGLRPLVNHAMAYVGAGRRSLFESTLQAWREHTVSSTPNRIDRALGGYLRDRREAPVDPRQRPTLLYIPDLGTSSLPALPQPAWLTTLLEKVATTGAEVDTCLRWAARNAPTTLPSLTPAGADNPQADNAAATTLGERQALIQVCGTVPDAARRHAPQLLSALATAPLMRIPRYAPDTTIIALPPGAHTATVYSRSNAGCSVVVGLPGSAGIEITIGTDKHRLEAGGAIIGDGSYGMDYANSGATEARLLVFDIWHPGLSTAEQQALTALLAAIVDFDTRLQELA